MSGPIPPGPAGPSPEPLQPSSSGSSSPEPVTPGVDPRYAFYLNSPWAKMFSQTGAAPTLAEIQAIINGVLQESLNAMNAAEEQAKKGQDELRKAIEGDDGGGD